MPISDFAAEILEKVLALGSRNFLFTYNDKYPVRSTTHARHRIEERMVELFRQELIAKGLNPNTAFIPTWELRDVRRTSATLMAELGHPIEVVDKILNHSGGHSGTGRTVNLVARIYIKYEFLDERRKALQDLGELIRKLAQQ